MLLEKIFFKETFLMSYFLFRNIIVDRVLTFETSFELFETIDASNILSLIGTNFVQMHENVSLLNFMGTLKFILNNYLEMSLVLNFNRLNLLFKEYLAGEIQLEALNVILCFK